MTASTSLPNLVLILADDLGWNMTGHTGNPHVSTPFLDAHVPSQALTLERHYAYTWCGPSRASLLTGRVPPRAGVSTHSGEMSTFFGPPTEMTLLPRRLRAAGYSTAFAGKWDAGMLYRELVPCSATRGFNVCLGYFPGGVDHWTMGVVVPDEGWVAEFPRPDDQELISLWDEKGPATDLVGSGVYGDYLFVKKATDFIAAHDATAGPLFLYLALQCSHRPFQVPAELLPSARALHREGVATSENTLAQLAMSTVIDDAARNVTEALQAAGLWDSSLIVFSSDNGGPNGKGTYADVNVPLRGYKLEEWEGAYRVYAFVSGGVLPEAMRGARSSALIAICDWYATFCGLAGLGDACASDEGAVAAGYSDVDSVDQWAVLSGAATRSQRTELWVDTYVLYQLERDDDARGEERLWKLRVGTNGTDRRTDLLDLNSSSAEEHDADSAEYFEATERAYLEAALRGEGVLLHDVLADPTEYDDLAQLTANSQRVAAMAATLYSYGVASPTIVSYLMGGMGPGLPLSNATVEGFVASSIRSGYNLAPIDWYDDDHHAGNGDAGGGGDSAFGTSNSLRLLLVGVAFGAMIGLGCDRARRRSFWPAWRGLDGEQQGADAAIDGKRSCEKELRAVCAAGSGVQHGDRFRRLDEYVD